mmetsp:Transcript_94479/g.237076  ORF Transcript_94479/g.237076 Transcript_94479/m.237076 type:complete len:106 (-) Transcript_94479:175-492(-)
MYMGLITSSRCARRSWLAPWPSSAESIVITCFANESQARKCKDRRSVYLWSSCLSASGLPNTGKSMSLTSTFSCFHDMQTHSGMQDPPLKQRDLQTAAIVLASKR